MVMEKEVTSGIKKKAIKAAVAATASASLLVGSSYASPDELIHPKPLIEKLDNEDNQDEAVKGHVKFTVRFKRWFSSLPMWIRITAGLPLWALGSFLIFVASSLWARIISPALSMALMIALIGGILLATLVMLGKMMLPNIPLKKFFNRKAVITVLEGIGVYLLIDNTFPRFWPEYHEYSRQILITTFIITIICGLYQYWHDLHETKLVITSGDLSFEQ